MHKRSLFALVLLVAMAALLAACGSETTPTPTTGAPTATPAAGQTPNPTAATTPTSAPSFDAEAFFRGKTITMVTSSNPGGSTDIAARYFASQWGKFIPGNPRIVVSNITPHLAGINYIWNRPANGLTIGILSHNPIREEDFEGAQYDIKEFGYVGDIVESTNVWLVSGELGYTDIRDAVGKAGTGPEIVMAEPAPSANDLEGSIIGRMMMADWFDIPLRMRAIAETGTGIDLLNFERGNTNSFQLGDAWFTLPSLRPGWLRDGVAVPFADYASFGESNPNSEWAELGKPMPTHFYELLDEQQLRQYQGIVDSKSGMGVPIFIPPNYDEGLLEALRAAFETAMNDAAFLEGMNRVVGIDPILVTGEQLHTVAVEGQATWHEFRDQEAGIKQRLFDKFFQ